LAFDVRKARVCKHSLWTLAFLSVGLMIIETFVVVMPALSGHLL